MINPFDKTFLKFLVGFLFILGMSFAIFYGIGVYSQAQDAAQADAVHPAHAK